MRSQKIETKLRKESVKRKLLSQGKRKKLKGRVIFKKRSEDSFLTPCRQNISITSSFQIPRRLDQPGVKFEIAQKKSFVLIVKR